MTTPLSGPCDDAFIQSGLYAAPSGAREAAWILAATILGSSMGFIDGTVVNVALPALQRELNPTLVDVHWVVESYALSPPAPLRGGGAPAARPGPPPPLRPGGRPP